jgi:hypothetical protein
MLTAESLALRWVVQNGTRRRQHPLDLLNSWRTTRFWGRTELSDLVRKVIAPLGNISELYEKKANAEYAQRAPVAEHVSSGCSLERCSGLLFPSLAVDTPHDEP